MKPINMMKRTDCFGDPVTLHAWLSQLGKWRRLEQRIGALSSAAVWQMPVPDCIGWSFEVFGTKANGWCVLEIETGKCVSDVWHGLPDALLYSDPNHQWPHGVVLPQSCRIDHWNKMLSEALVRYDPVQSFRDGRFLTTRPWKFRDEAAISELLSHAVSTGLLDTQIDYCHPNDIFAVHPQWGWDLWNKWRMAQSDAVRIALEKKHSPELTAWQL